MADTPATPKPGNTTSAVAIGVGALLVGIAVGALAIDRPEPRPIPLTIHSFPQEVLGQKRDDVELREGGATTVIDRLDAHFEDQLAGYRFAYGGEGALFGYGEGLTLEIVNGQLAPDVPVLGDTEWSTPMVISLNTRDTTCVSLEGATQVNSTLEATLPLDPEVRETLERELPETLVLTDCVLFDERRNLALRLTGEGPTHNILTTAVQFRDELERIHADLVE